MRVVPDDYISYQYASSKKPVQVVEVEFDTDELIYITSHAGVATPGGETFVEGCLSSISSTSQTIDPSQGRSTIGSIRFSALDIDSAITDILKARDDGGDGFRHKTCRVYQAFEGMTWAQISANLVQTQIITGLSENKGLYSFQLSDVQRAARKNIFSKAKARLSATVSAAATLIPVFTTDGFETLLHDGSFTDAPDARVGYLLIDDEVIRYTGTVVDETLGLSFVVDERGALNTVAAEHEVDPEDTSDRATYAEEFIYLEMPAPKLIYAILTGDLYGQGSEVMPANWHLGIDPSFVRLADFTDIGVDLWDVDNEQGFILRFAGEKEQDGKQFIEQQICLLLSAFMPVYSTGELGFKLATSVLHQASYVSQLNEFNVKDFSAIKFEADQVHNILSVEWNYDFIRDKLTRQRVVADNTSRAKYGDAPVKTLKFRGLHGSRHTSQFIESIFDRLRDRFAAPPATMTIKALPYMNTLEVGDIVRVTLTGKDFFAGGTLDRAMEIQSVKTDWVTGNVDLKLFGSSQSAGLIAPLDPNNTYDPRFSIMADGYYAPAGGTDLAGYAGVNITVIGDVGHITGGTGIVGGDWQFSPESYFYYDGDLELDSGVVLPFSNNVQLRVKGNFQINGELNGTGLGYAGAAQTAADPPLMTDVNIGTRGFLTQNQYGGGVLINVLDAADIESAVFTTPIPLRGDVARLDKSITPQLTLTYNDALTSLRGIPTNLIGTAGSSGGNYTSLYPATFGPSHLAGGAGGASGAGLSIIARGVSFGASGRIESNGLPGSIGEQGADLGIEFNRWQGGTGGGGACGAVYFIIDGLTNNVPDLNKVELIYGAMPYSPAVPMPAYGKANNPPTITVGQHIGYGTNPPDLSGFNGGARVVFIPPRDQPEQDLLIAQPLTEVEWEDVQNTSGNKAANNATAGATWGSDIASQPVDASLLNDQQEWNDVQDAGGTKPANNATQNNIYRQESEPVGTTGDLWYKPSTKILKENFTGVWSEIGNGFSDTGDLTDGANLGGTSTWAGTTGSGKPADNADVTSSSNQGAAWLTDSVVGSHNLVSNANNDDYFSDNSITAEWYAEGADSSTLLGTNGASVGSIFTSEEIQASIEFATTLKNTHATQTRTFTPTLYRVVSGTYTSKRVYSDMILAAGESARFTAHYDYDGHDLGGAAGSWIATIKADAVGGTISDNFLYIRALYK